MHIIYSEVSDFLFEGKHFERTSQEADDVYSL